MRRWLFNIAAGLSLLLLGCVVYFCGDTYFFQHEHNTVTSIGAIEVVLVSNRDGVYFSVSRHGAYNNLAPDIDAGKRQIHTYQVGRFCFERITGTPWLWLVRVPPLFLAIATAILPLAWAFRQPFRRRAGQGPLPRVRLQPHRQRLRHVPRMRHAPREAVGTMRRLRFTLASPVSLALCIGTAERARAIRPRTRLPFGGIESSPNSLASSRFHFPTPTIFHRTSPPAVRSTHARNDAGEDRGP